MSHGRKARFARKARPTAPDSAVSAASSEGPGMDYQALRLAGRCANVSERDGGARYHAVPPHSIKALCGATYGRRSAGWSEYPGDKVTCPRCQKKLEKQSA